jgi:hypothetical protein
LTRSPNLKDVRPALKRAAKDAWQSVGSMTNKASADGTLASVCADQVRHVFEHWAGLMRAASGEQKERCGICDSLRVVKWDGEDGPGGTDLRVLRSDVMSAEAMNVAVKGFSRPRKSP